MEVYRFPVNNQLSSSVGYLTIREVYGLVILGWGYWIINEKPWPPDQGFEKWARQDSNLKPSLLGTTPDVNQRFELLPVLHSSPYRCSPSQEPVSMLSKVIDGAFISGCMN